MSTLTDDVRAEVVVRHPATGLAFAITSAVTFGMSGALVRPLLDAGWTPAAVAFARIGIAALGVLPFAVRALAGRWDLLRRRAGSVIAYGLIAVAGTQFAYFSAVAHMDVAPALLIEYTAPALVVVWLWVRHGERPGRTTVLGAILCALGLVLVLDLVSGADLSPVGVAWALSAVAGCAFYFVTSADETSGLPGIVLAGGGMLVGAVVLGGLGLVHVLPMRASSVAVTYAGSTVAWWVPVIGLGVITAAIAYVTGIEAAQRLGSRLASFVALSEVVSGVVWAWVLLGQLPHAVQLVGGLLVVGGVVAVKLGERRVVATPA